MKSEGTVQVSIAACGCPGVTMQQPRWEQPDLPIDIRLLLQGLLTYSLVIFLDSTGYSTVVSEDQHK